MAIVLLVVAAIAEVLGDVGMRRGLGGHAAGYILGVLLLVGYGLLVNQPALAFGRTLGLYIAVFFAVSQGVAFLVFGERPTGALLVGGVFIVAGGLIIHFCR